MKWFGENWLGPICTRAEHADAPLGERCARCDRPFNGLDTGFLLPYYSDDNQPAYLALHRQCFINAVLRQKLPDEPVVEKMPGFHMGLDAPVIAYCAEECWRQGHRGDSNFLRTLWMMRAWEYAAARAITRLPPNITLQDIITIGKLVEPQENARGLRKGAATVNGHPRPKPENVKPLLDDLLAHQAHFTSLQFYREFALIHPFADGTGPTGKILLNWRNRTLHQPIFPPHDFWGRSILNP